MQDIAEGDEARSPRHAGRTPIFELPGSIPEDVAGHGADYPRRNGSGSRRFRSSTVGARLGMGSSRGASRSEVGSRLQRNHSEMSSKRGSREYESSIVDVLDVVGELLLDEQRKDVC